MTRGLLPAATPEYVQFLRGAFPNSKILMVRKRCPREELCRLLLLGAQGFVEYGDVEKSLARAVETLWAGSLWVHPRVLDCLTSCAARRVKSRPKVPLEALTCRERFVVELLQERLSNKEISTTLNISVATVKLHLENIYNKLGLHDRDLVARKAAMGSPTKPLTA